MLPSFPRAGRELAHGLEWLRRVKVNTLGTSLLFWCPYTSSMGARNRVLGLTRKPRSMAMKTKYKTELRPEPITELQGPSQRTTGPHNHGLTLLSAYLFLPAYGFEVPQKRTEASSSHGIKGSWGHQPHCLEPRWRTLNESLDTVLCTGIHRQAQKQGWLFQESSTEGIWAGACLHQGSFPKARLHAARDLPESGLAHGLPRHWPLPALSQQFWSHEPASALVNNLLLFLCQTAKIAACSFQCSSTRRQK